MNKNLAAFAREIRDRNRAAWLEGPPFFLWREDEAFPDDGLIGPQSIDLALDHVVGVVEFGRQQGNEPLEPGVLHVRTTAGLVALSGLAAESFLNAWRSRRPGASWRWPREIGSGELETPQPAKVKR